MRIHIPDTKFSCFCRNLGPDSARRSAALLGMLMAANALVGSFLPDSRAQQSGSAPPVVVQPGAPGQPSKTLPSSTKGTLPPRSQADVDFMQGMIMHHSQAIAMTALISSHTK